MNQQEFITELESIVMTKKGSLTPESILDDINWDSMAALEYQALADDKLELQLDPTDIGICRTVGDLCKLAGISA
jgi:acyl carrier protein